ncbi:MAG: cytochrome c oxidase subunit II [Anaerolineae bacterium]
MRNRKHLIAVTLIFVVVAALLFVVLSNLYQLPVAASAQAGPIDTMFRAHFIVISVLFSLIMVFVLYSVVVFRRKPGDEEDGPHVHGHTGLEVSWTVLPVILVISFGIWGTTTLNDLVRPDPKEKVVKVFGQQWSWSFEYPDHDSLASAELVLPVNQPILLQMEARDVLHSFWVPEFRVKQDLVPGRVTQLRITPTKVGTYKVRCAEICGRDHATMLADVRVLSQSDFDAWVAERTQVTAYGELTPEERGQIWYSSPEGGFAICSACHTVDGSVGAGPTWLGLYGREEQLADGTTVVIDEEYIRQSILDPNAQIVSGFNPNIMPQDYEAKIVEKQEQILAEQGVEIDIIADIIAYIKTLEE